MHRPFVAVAVWFNGAGLAPKLAPPRSMTTATVQLKMMPP